MRPTSAHWALPLLAALISSAGCNSSDGTSSASGNGSGGTKSSGQTAGGRAAGNTTTGQGTSAATGTGSGTSGGYDDGGYTSATTAGSSGGSSGAAPTTGGGATGSAGGSATNGGTTSSSVTGGGSSGLCGSVDCSQKPGEPYCGATRQCVQCTQDSECSGSTPRCQTDTTSDSYGDCVHCLSGGDCPTGSTCVPSVYFCSGDCRIEDAGCSGATPFCDPNSGACVQCLDVSVCQAGMVCKGGNCAFCTSNSDCAMSPNLQFCNPESQCVQCLKTTDCDAGTCEGDHCVL